MREWNLGAHMWQDFNREPERRVHVRTEVHFSGEDHREFGEWFGADRVGGNIVLNVHAVRNDDRRDLSIQRAERTRILWRDGNHTLSAQAHLALESRELVPLNVRIERDGQTLKTASIGFISAPLQKVLRVVVVENNGCWLQVGMLERWNVGTFIIPRYLLIINQKITK